MNKRFAVPTIDGTLCTHFGHCQKFAIIEADDSKVISEEIIDPPAHQPGVYPQFLAQLGVNVVLSGGMGQKALQLFAQNNIEVYTGVNAESPTKLVENFLSDQLQAGANRCDH
ncbi:MAG: NifB/NifX family molybdenum-iron cluster-binding protein [Deferribacteres bacterium]|nr:NifB/NifX family molybdenum-iron cluster-binding protein [Deferribacteres bacterium]